MTIERRGSFGESRKNGVGMVSAILGKRVWLEVRTPTVFKSLKIEDQNSVAKCVDVYQGGRNSCGWYEIEIYTRNVINKKLKGSGIRWSPSYLGEEEQGSIGQRRDHIDHP